MGCYPGHGARLDLVCSCWLPKLWRLVSGSLAIIFQRNEFWAPYFHAEEMVIWMRDALGVTWYLILQQAAQRPGEVTSREDGEIRLCPPYCRP